jgi:hypothetical protein
VTDVSHHLLEWIDSDFWCIAKFSGSRSTGRLHFLPTGEMRSPATPSHPSPSFPLLKKYSHHQGSNQIRIDRQYATNRCFCCCCRSATRPWACAPWRSSWACSSPSATNSPRYPTSATIAESDFDNCLPIAPSVLL